MFKAMYDLHLNYWSFIGFTHGQNRMNVRIMM